MKPKQFTEEKGGVVHVHFEPKGTYIREDDVYRLMKEYADHQSLAQRVMPRSLTAENGAKALLNGEFVECFDPNDSGNPYIVTVSWDNIKKIYKRIVDHYLAK